MTKIKIKKIESEDTYYKKCWEDIFEVNGKRILVLGWDIQDSKFSDYDSGYEIDEDDRELLTDEELELFEEDMQELLELKVGGVINKEIEE